eukprot:99706-Chlamydomonas_euryale.AAC.1
MAPAEASASGTGSQRRHAPRGASPPGRPAAAPARRSTTHGGGGGVWWGCWRGLVRLVAGFG